MNKVTVRYCMTFFLLLNTKLEVLKNIYAAAPSHTIKVKLQNKNTNLHKSIIIVVNSTCALCFKPSEKIFSEQSCSLKYVVTIHFYCIKKKKKGSLDILLTSSFEFHRRKKAIRVSNNMSK